MYVPLSMASHSACTARLRAKAGGKHWGRAHTRTHTHTYAHARAHTHMTHNAYIQTNTTHTHITQMPATVTEVHVIHSNHFDAGYTDGVLDVINTYFDEFFPRAIAVGAELRARVDTPLGWMTQSYLVDIYLNCPTDLGLHCPNASSIAAFETAVRFGDIRWHAYPTNAELALLDPSPVCVRFGSAILAKRVWTAVGLN